MNVEALAPIMICRDRGADDGWWGRLRCPGRSNASPLRTFLILADRLPLPWLRSSSWPIDCLSLGWVPRPGQSNASPLRNFLQQDSASAPTPQPHSPCPYET